MSNTTHETISIQDAIKLIKDDQYLVHVPLDEIHETESQPESVFFWTDAYLVFKTPQGGEIYCGFYADAELDNEIGFGISINDDNLHFNTENLQIIDENGDVLDMDDTNAITEAFNQHLKFGDQDWEQDISVKICHEIVNKLGSNFTTDQLKQHPNFKPA